jgi:hypothetical protein
LSISVVSVFFTTPEAAMARHSEGKPVLLSDRQVAQRYDVVVRTLERWDLQPDLGFPPPVRINRRRYRELAALETWEKKKAAQAGSRAEPAQTSPPT